jgi:hypothetical protein
LWRLSEVRLVTSAYALTEADRNIELKRPEATECLRAFSNEIEVSLRAVPASEDFERPEKNILMSGRMTFVMFKSDNYANRFGEAHGICDLHRWLPPEPFAVVNWDPPGL